MNSIANFDMDLAALWEATSKKLRNGRLYVNSLEELLISKGVKESDMIIDVAGGFGFPTIDLAKRGWQILYMDGSQEMLARAVRNAQLQNAPTYIFTFQCTGCVNVPWQELGENISSESFEALICTGNSLPYIVSWGKSNPDLSESRKQILSALNHFHRILTPNGVLYIDKQPEAQEYAVEDVGEIELEGKKYNVITTFNNDKVNRVRNWTLKTKNLETREEKEYPSRGYLILENELVSLLTEVGFKDIERYNLKGDIYEGFVARKK